MSPEDYKENLSKYKFWLACRAYSFQSSTCTKANHLYILISNNQDGDQKAAVVCP